MNKEIKHQPKLNPEDKIEYVSEYITVKKNEGYYYAERKGVDSVAFVLFSIDPNDEKRIGIVKEFKSPVNEFVLTAFGGSIDDEKYHNDLRELVVEEALEEAGFTISVDQVDYYGKCFVSTQMNQYCHLFGVNVDKKLQGKKTTTNIRELDSVITWITLPELYELEDWKAITIVTKRLVSNSTVIMKAGTVKEEVKM